MPQCLDATALTNVDVLQADSTPVPAGRALQVFKLFKQVVDALVVNKARALEEVQADYSTTTEIADALLQRAEVPFRTGHHFASKLTDFGRGKGMKLQEIPFAEVQRIYAENSNEALPISEKDYADIISAEYMVFGRKGLGEPQVAELNRMIVSIVAATVRQKDWLNDRPKMQTTFEQRFTALIS